MSKIGKNSNNLFGKIKISSQLAWQRIKFSILFSADDVDATSDVDGSDADTSSGDISTALHKTCLASIFIYLLLWSKHLYPLIFKGLIHKSEPDPKKI